MGKGDKKVEKVERERGREKIKKKMDGRDVEKGDKK